MNTRPAKDPITLNVRMPRRLYDGVQRLAAAYGAVLEEPVTVSQYLRALLEEKLRELEAQP